MRSHSSKQAEVEYKKKTVQRIRNQAGIHTKKIATKQGKCKWLPRALFMSKLKLHEVPVTLKQH